jgi:hypothetical protein
MICACVTPSSTTTCWASNHSGGWAESSCPRCTHSAPAGNWATNVGSSRQPFRGISAGAARLLTDASDEHFSSSPDTEAGSSTFAGLGSGHSANRFDLVHDQVDWVGTQRSGLESPPPTRADAHRLRVGL